MKVYHLDYETRSRIDLRKLGAARYASDPSTRILMFAIACGDDEPLGWLNPQFGVKCGEEKAAKELLAQAVSEAGRGEALIYAHNAPFEMFLSEYRMGADLAIAPPPLEAWRCTAAMARKAGLRSSLADLGDDLGLQQLKFGIGYALIRKFSIPQKGTDEFTAPSSEREEFLKMLHYCKQDVRSEREAHHRLKPFELKGLALEAFLFDLRLNRRGFPVNVMALQHAQSIIEAKQAQVAAEFSKLTGLQPTQRDKVKELLELMYGVKLKNMKGETLDAYLSYHEDPDEDADDELLNSEIDTDDETAKRIVELYKQVRFAAVKKIRTMLDCVCEDGYIRGMFTWHGAGTGRWTAQKVQPQNFRSPKVADADDIYSMICSGASAEDIEMVHGNVLEAIANCIRNFIHGPWDIYDADYSAIEARIVAWLANEKWRMEVFKTHGKIYEASACEMFGLRMEQVTKAIRQKGKIAELALGYQGAVGAMKTMGALKMGLKEIELYEIVTAWRDANPQIVQTWEDLETAARNAVLNPGQRFTACADRIAFCTKKVAGIPYLLMQLPSGRNIAYPHPKIESVPAPWDPKRTIDALTYYGQLPNGKKWGRVSLYGGKILENATQGIAADVMSHGSVNAERLGFAIFMLVHDQALASCPATPDLEKFLQALTELPEWADGLPLKADGEIAPYYRKDL